MLPPHPPNIVVHGDKGIIGLMKLLKFHEWIFFLLSKAQHKYCGPRDEKGMAEGHPEVGEDGFFPTPPLSRWFMAFTSLSTGSMLVFSIEYQALQAGI